MRDACTDDAVLHALRWAPDKEFKALRQAIFNNADLQLAEEIKLRPDLEKARQQQKKWN